MRNLSNKLIIVALLIAICLLFLRSCQLEKDYKRVSSALTVADLKNQKFETELNEKGEQINSQKQLILSKEEAIQNNLIEIEDLKKYKRIKSKTKIVTQTKIDTVFVAFDPVDKNDSTFVPLPSGFLRTFKYLEKDDWFKFSGTVSENGLTMNNMEIKNDYSLLIADKKLGLFSKAEPQVVLTNLNPYTRTVSMNNVQIQYKKPFYKKEWFWFVLGATTTTIIIK